MRTDLENRFFEAFELGGVALSCIRILADNATPERWDTIDQQERQRIIAETGAFDFSIINSNRKAPIIQEIEVNLHLLTGRERMNYLYSLLIPFGDWLRMARGGIEATETEWSKQRAKSREPV
jgi:predicted membrane chloride channel (bestrophin family)